MLNGRKLSKSAPFQYIEAYEYIQNQTLENGKLYSNEKLVIYNPDIYPTPITKEHHFVKNLFLEKMPLYPIKTPKRKKNVMKKTKKIKDSLLLYRKKQKNRKIK
jgi:hypothetical protein